MSFIKTAVTPATHPTGLPDPGDLMDVRGRHWLVENLNDKCDRLVVISFSSIDHALGEKLCVVWDTEIMTLRIADDYWQQSPCNCADSSEVIAKYMRQLKWPSATSAIEMQDEELALL